MKEKKVSIVGVVVEFSPDFPGKLGSFQAVLWNFGLRKCSIIISTEVQATLAPIVKGAVLLVTNPSLEFYDGQLQLMCESHSTVQVVGLAKDYGVCGHKDKVNTINMATMGHFIALAI